jgi:transcriptional repressor NrdR
VRRRRQCNVCEKRFTTYERVEETAGLVVIKRDGSRVSFDREKIMRGVQLACGKRPIAEDAKSAIVDAVDEEVHRDFDREVPSSVIGEKVMQRLKDLDEVAYVRFASEHYQFNSVGDMRRHAEELEARVKDVKNQQRLFTAE